MLQGFRQPASLPLHRLEITAHSQTAAPTLEFPEKEVPSEHAKPCQTWHRVPQESDLSDVIWHTPTGGSSSREKHDISRTDPAFFVLAIADERLTDDDHQGLVLVVVPVELARRAIPDHDVRRSVVTAD